MQLKDLTLEKYNRLKTRCDNDNDNNNNNNNRNLIIKIIYKFTIVKENKLNNWLVNCI